MSGLGLPDSIPWAVVDTEGSGLHVDDGARVSCVAVTWEEDGDLKTLAFPFDQGTRDKFPTQQLDLFEAVDDVNLPESAWVELLDWLALQKLVFHNAKHDLNVFRAGTREWPGRDLLPAFWWDTLFAQGELDPTHPKGLGEVGQRLGLGEKQNEDVLKNWLKRNKFPTSRYDLVPWWIIEPYVSGDTELTARLLLHQLARFDAGEGDAAERDRQFDLIGVLYNMEGRGVAYDAASSLEVAEELERRANELERRMPFKVNINNGKKYFFETLDLPADRTTEKGNPSLDEEQVRTFAKEGVEWAPEYEQVTKARRAVSMWYRGYPEKMGMDGRLRTSFKQGSVRSGRMSVERVQLQAIPKSDKAFEGLPEVRKLLRAKEGYGLWSLDLSQAELRVASKYSKCQRMLEQLSKPGADIHGETCENLLHTTRDSEDWKVKRDIAKRMNFSCIFQVGGEKFQATLSKMADIYLPLDECNQLVWGWRNMYPEFGWYYRRADRFFAEKGYVRLLPNTEYEIKSYMGPRDYSNTGWNRVVQGSLAQAFKLLMIGIERQWPGLMLLTIHDSVLLEMKLDEGDQIAAEIAEYGAELTTGLFDIEMSLDVDRWA